MHKVLSIFVDESGDFGKYEPHSPYYIVSMVFHDQDNSINDLVEKLDHELLALGFGGAAIHTEPLVRNEELYTGLEPNKRRTLLTKLYYFMRKADISFQSFIVHKRENPEPLKVEEKLARDISSFIKSHLSDFQKYDEIILYYDNGQRELTRILNAVFASTLSKYETRRVFPHEYKLFQVADLICTLELTKQKLEVNHFTKSDERIFHSKKDFNKDFLKGLEKKRWR